MFRPFPARASRSQRAASVGRGRSALRRQKQQVRDRPERGLNERRSHDDPARKHGAADQAQDHFDRLRQQEQRQQLQRLQPDREPQQPSVQRDRKKLKVM